MQSIGFRVWIIKKINEENMHQLPVKCGGWFRMCLQYFYCPYICTSASNGHSMSYYPHFFITWAVAIVSFFSSVYLLKGKLKRCEQNILVKLSALKAQVKIPQNFISIWSKVVRKGSWVKTLLKICLNWPKRDWKNV